MRLLILSTFLIISGFLFAQSIEVRATVLADSLPENMGRAMIFSLPDSTLVKGTYLDSNTLQTRINAADGASFFLKITAPGFADTTIAFNATAPVTNLGTIRLVPDQLLDEVSVVYSKPVFERTMDGISVNVKGTTLEQLNTLFDVLKASPRLTSPDDESIEIIGLGSPLILIDRQAIISNDELKAIPADQVDRIEIITSPSAKYKAQGSGSGVIEVYTNNFALEGYRATINGNGGISTQLFPVGYLNPGLNFKKGKFSMNGYLGVNYHSSNNFGSSEGGSLDNSNKYSSEYGGTNYNIWRYYNMKMAYDINKSQRLTLGVNGRGSTGGNKYSSESQYYIADSLTMRKINEGDSKYKWLNNAVFLNYVFETDTFGSALEVNLNYLNKVSANESFIYSDIIEAATNTNNGLDARTISDDQPNIGEMRVNYEHYFDTSRWILKVGGSYSLLINGKSFDRYLYTNNDWAIDPTYSNSYDYQEDIGAVFTEISKKWDKFGFRVGVRVEYTKLYGNSKSLNQTFMDSNYFRPFPNASLLFDPNDTISIKLSYSSGINRPQFNNYDPFIRIEDSLNINYGNPYLRPAIEHSIGLEVDLFYAYNLSVYYTYYDQPTSTLSLTNPTTFVTENTPRNARYEESYSVSLGLPMELDWLSGWTSLWVDYNKYVFTDEFQREPFSNTTFGAYSYLTFKLPKDFSIMNRLNVYRWGSAGSTSNINFHWGLRLTKKLLNDDLRLHVEVDNLLPQTRRSQNFQGNFAYSSASRNNFTSFRIGLFYKFGRLKAAANIQESSSGQSDRL